MWHSKYGELSGKNFEIFTTKKFFVNIYRISKRGKQEKELSSFSRSKQRWNPVPSLLPVLVLRLSVCVGGIGHLQHTGDAVGEIQIFGATVPDMITDLVDDGCAVSVIGYRR